MSESTFTNAAAAVAEGAAYPEAALAYSEVTMPIRKVAVHLPVTEEQLEDDAGVEDLIRGRLTEMVRLQMDSQLLSGTGVAPQLTGYRNVSGISAVAQGAGEAVLDAIYRGIVSVRATGRAIPDAIIIHPSDLQTVRLAKTVDGVYLFGSPAVGPELPIWGVRVIETDAIPTKKVLVGDFARHSALVMRSGVDVQVGYSTDGFVKGVKTIRLDVRAALAVFRPSAFCEVTLL
jgi:HK97 family phage major capsid protein